MIGTPFEMSRTPLQKWFDATYLFTTTWHGVSAKELQRQLGVTYKTAWRMSHTHGKVNHRSKEYVIGRDHVNNIGAFSLILKWSIRGTHV